MDVGSAREGQRCAAPGYSYGLAATTHQHRSTGSPPQVHTCLRSGSFCEKRRRRRTVVIAGIIVNVPSAALAAMAIWEGARGGGLAVAVGLSVLRAARGLSADVSEVMKDRAMMPTHTDDIDRSEGLREGRGADQ